MSRDPSRLSVTSVLADGRLALMLALGYSAGLPFLLVFGTLSTWLRESGVPVTTIGLFSWLALAYSLKFLWSPIVDGVDLPVLARRLGRRRAWMLTAQILVVVGLIGTGLSAPGTQLWVTATFAFLVALGGATQDVVIDAWRIDVAPTSRQGVMVAVYNLGYRFALICAGAGALYIAEYGSWRIAYLVMAALMLVGIAATLLSSPSATPPGESKGRQLREQLGAVFQGRLGLLPRRVLTFLDSLYGLPLRDLIARKGATGLALILVLVALYRLPDFVAGVMANPLYIDLGFSKIEIANISKLYGVWIGMIGAFAGGLILPRIGLTATLLIGAVAGAGSNLMFSWLALAGRDITLLTLAISVDNFAGSFAGTALIAYMSGLTAPGYAATQYALLSSLYALPGKLVGGISGFLVAAYGYATFFALTAAVGIPVVILCLLVGRETAREEAAPAGETVPAE